MILTTTFDVARPRPQVFAYLSNPRNLIVVNREGPVVEQSDGPLQAGSWYVLALDQLRVRVEYTEFDPDRRLAVSVTMSGWGSGGTSSRHAFTLSDLDGGLQTRIEAVADGRGGWLRWGPLVRASQRAVYRRMRNRMEASG